VIGISPAVRVWVCLLPALHGDGEVDVGEQADRGPAVPGFLADDLPGLLPVVAGSDGDPMLASPSGSAQLQSDAGGRWHSPVNSLRVWLRVSVINWFPGV